MRARSSRESQRFDWLTERAPQVRAAIGSGQLVAPPPLRARISWDIPDSPAWRAATSSGRLSLTPQEDIEVYGEVDWLLAEISTAYQARLLAAKRRSDFEYEFERDGVLGLSSARPDDLRKYLDLIADEHSATAAMRS